MPRLTITITDEQAEILEGKTGDGGEYESKSEAVRTFITEYERLTERVDELQNERDRLQRQLAATNSRIDEVTELVEYVDEQRELERYRERRERMVDQAGVLTRAKWWLTGVPVDGDRSDDSELEE
ncbi:hypothetical protein [Natronococcus sp. A-GB7]|uniref:hypothetical protein n=1 Tax=Natronococcus sp. A-GB7 TaxID=3037649 RepID=UPI00241DD5F7|nr:hypothetical protein [Natronococcus sp. A-GB7]MDG5821635.1 hypothetical protein [Natronococcus sp. A-GB7]